LMCLSLAFIFVSADGEIFTKHRLRGVLLEGEEHTYWRRYI
jgi:hypothetical protein